MRKLALPLAAVVALGSVGVAQAVNPDQTIDIKVGTTKAAKKVKATVLDVTTGTTPAAGEKFAVTRAVIHFDSGLKFNPAKFPGCTLAQVESLKCSSKAKVGAGSAKALAGGSGGLPVNDIKVTAYNGKNGKQIYLLVQESQFNIQKALVGTLKSDTGAFGKKLDVVIPSTLQSVAGLPITLTEFKTKISKRVAKGVPYVGLAKCTGKVLEFKGDFTYSDGTSKSATDTVACK